MLVPLHKRQLLREWDRSVLVHRHEQNHVLHSLRLRPFKRGKGNVWKLVSTE